MTEFGNVALVEEREELEGGNVTLKLPGVKTGDMASRVLKPEVIFIQLLQNVQLLILIFYRLGCSPCNSHQLDNNGRLPLLKVF